MKKSFKPTACFLAVFFALSLANFCNAQKNVEPFRIGLKFGVPILAGLNLEYVTPALNHKLSADMDFSYFPITVGSAKLSYSYLGIGTDYYFLKPGRGLYGGIGYGRLGFTATETLKSTSNGIPVSGVGNGSSANNNLNLKIGGKHGGLFYFRWELGYGIEMSSTKLVVATEATAPGATPVHVEDKINIPFAGLPIVNIGFGFAF